MWLASWSRRCGRWNQTEESHVPRDLSVMLRKIGHQQNKVSDAENLLRAIGSLRDSVSASFASDRL